MLALLLFQGLVDSVVQTSAGEYTAAVTRPGALPFNFVYPVSRTNCTFDDDFSLELDISDKGSIYYTEPPGQSLGSYAGVPKTLAAQALLGDDFVEPNGNISSGFLGNMSTPVTAFYACSYPHFAAILTSLIVFLFSPA
jgi:hypothetical protein